MLGHYTRRQSLRLVRSFTGGREDGINVSHSSQLRVVSTNQWPIPYYKRQSWAPRSLYPDSDYNVKIMNTEVGSPDDVNVFMAEKELKNTVWGREVLDTMHKLNLKGTLNTQIASPARAAEVYMEDLLTHLDYPRKENRRILKKHKFEEVFS